MTIIDAYKMNGLGNDFLIIDRRTIFINLKKDKIIELGKKNKLGFDQIIFIDKEIKGSSPITIYNSDGNEVSACGNGSRCIAYLLCKEKNSSQIYLKTNERILEAEIVGDLSVRVNMGKPIFNWSQIPLSEDIDNKNINIDIGNKRFVGGYALNVGNPHIIFFMEDCFSLDIKTIGPKIENHKIFPEKCNVTFAQINSRNEISVNVWERGAGLTKACGTAACATAVASYLKDLTENKVNVRFKEGSLEIELNKTQEIFMTGPVSDIIKIKLEI